jgi:hypothetical protein
MDDSLPMDRKYVPKDESEAVSAQSRTSGKVKQKQTNAQQEDRKEQYKQPQLLSACK